MSSKPDIKKLLKYGAPALLDLGNPNRSGELRRQHRSRFGRKKWQLCYVILARDCLFVFENKNSTNAQFASHVSSFECAKGKGTVDGEDVCFVVRFEEDDKKSLIFACDVDKTRQKWIKSINDVTSNVKNFSADSAYYSGGSLSNGSLRNEHENNYNEIDDSEVTAQVVGSKQTKQDKSGHDKQNASDTHTVANTYSGTPHGTLTRQRQPTSIQPVSDQQDSGFVNVGIHSSPITRVKTPNTKRKGTINEDTQHMECLKLSVPETNIGSDNPPCELNCAEDPQNIYENTEDAFALYSNVDLPVPPACEPIRHNSPSASKYGTMQKTKPKVAPKPIKRCQTDPDLSEMSTKPSLVQPVSAQQDSGHLMVGGCASSTERKTVFESGDVVPDDTRSDNIHRLQNLKLDTMATPSNSDSGGESPIYENTHFGKVFERDDYLCSSPIHSRNLMSTPVGTFFVRPGKETKHELVIRTNTGTPVFRIHEKNGFCYLTEGNVFSSLECLVGHYSITDVPSQKFKGTLKRGYHSCSK